MKRDSIREAARLRRLLWRIYAELPVGALPDRVEARLEGVVAPGYRERIGQAFLASLSAFGQDKTH